MIGVKNYLKNKFFKRETDPELAYNIWASSYDAQPDNLMLTLDKEVFWELLSKIELVDKVLVDIGCGTGRHWQKLYASGLKKITGFDVSEKMLEQLAKKFPQAESYRLVTNKLYNLKDNSCDIVISTLAIAHIKNVAEALAEWSRILKPGGHIIITDNHPTALAKGADRTFKHNDKKIAIINYVHPVENIIKITSALDLTIAKRIEKNIDDSVRSYYEKQQAIAVFEKWKNTPIIYGILLKKADGIS
ncbi:MAG TPA: methyltransferase domain-containing protein [Ferruginibacter sp.]|jgi:ubiquinone/menaquinone biosynthesis C-methylase UbiE|nr:methyltransferase domain-containing protein [Ferruginibacter sp.]